MTDISSYFKQKLTKFLIIIILYIFLKLQIISYFGSQVNAS